VLLNQYNNRPANMPKKHQFPKPRIAIISDTAPPTSEGGIGSAHYNLFRALRGKGLNVELFLFYDKGNSGTEKHPDKTIHRFGPPQRMRKYLLILNRWVFSIISPGKIAWNTGDVFASGLGVRRMNPALKAFDPQIIIVPDHGAPALWLYKPYRAKICLIAHHNPMRFVQSKKLGNYSRLDARIAVWLEQKALNSVSQVSFPSHHMETWFRRTYKFSGKTKLIPNLIDRKYIESIKEDNIRLKMGLSKDGILIGIPSAQTEIKGSRELHAIIAGIAKRVNQPIGIFIAGEMNAALKNKLMTLPQKIRLHTPGRLSHHEYVAIFKACSFGIFPSLQDNYSMALLEAVFSGVPMVAFDSGGNADIIKDRKNGFLVQNLSLTTMIEVCADLVNNPRKLVALRKTTGPFTESHLDTEKTLKAYIAFFINGA
jgi:glycosyltransferase involved in cell wall biosynthesis